MTKKLISLFVSICLLLSLTACVIKYNSDVEGTTATEILTEVITSESAETIATEETFPDEDAEFIPSPEAPILDFDVTGFDLVEDYEGNPALIVFFIWTNNGEETAMFDVEYMVKAFQDGISLNHATLSWEHKYEEVNSNLMTEIRPGATIEVAHVFSLRSDSTIVEIEVDEWISFDDKPLMLLTIDTSAKG